MGDYQLPVKAIKNIMLAELCKLYDDARASIRTLSDAPRNMLSIGYDQIRIRIQNAQDYSALDAVCGEVYGITLAAWVQSL